MQTKAKLILFICIMCSIVCMMGCQSQNAKPQSIHGGNDIPIYPNQNGGEQTSVQNGTKKYSEGKGLVIEVDIRSKTCTILVLDTSEKVVYSYNGGTEIFDRHGEPISIEQLELGEIIQYEYVTVGKRLTKLSEWSEAWEYFMATDFKIDKERKILLVGEEEYTYTEDVIVVQDGRIISIDKLESVDVVTLKGRKNQVDSILVTQGHGYVRLDSTTYFEGGYVDIGSDYVGVITENMVVPMPIGDYILTVMKNDTTGSKEISVEENEEIRVNLTDFQEEAVRFGSVQFKIEPAGAVLKIDGKETVYSGLVDLSYGSHSIEVRKDGYGTYTQTIIINSILSEFDITLLEEETTSEQETSEQESTTEQMTTDKKEEATTRWPYIPTEETTTYDANRAWYDIVSGVLTD